MLFRSKQAIARAALDLVADGEVVLVDSGTTALEFVRMLDMRTGITVITADVTIADYIDDSLPTVDVVLLGGSLRKGHRYLYGPLTLGALSMVHADLAVLCPGAYVPTRGFMTDYPQMAELKSALIRTAARTCVLMDASKVAARGMMRVADLADVDAVVMDADPQGIVASQLDTLAENDRPRLIVA